MIERYFTFWLTRRRVALLVVLELGLAWVIYYNVWRIGQLTGLPILDMDVGFGPARVNEVLGGYTAEARARYDIIQIADVLHPAVYATLLGAVIGALGGLRRGGVLAVPVVFAALLDWGENLMIWRMTSQPLPVDVATAETASWLSLAKHMCLWLTAAILVLLVVRRLVRALMM